MGKLNSKVLKGSTKSTPKKTTKKKKEAE